MGIMFQEMHLSGVPAVVDSYGSVLLRDGADLYVIIAVAAFVAGAIFNLLISADGIWRWMGYLFPSGMIIVLVSVWHLMVKLNHMK